MYYWDFGDGNTSFSPNPEHTFSEAGLFPVTLTACDSFGCNRDLTMGVLVKDEIIVYVPNSFITNGDEVIDVLNL